MGRDLEGPAVGPAVGGGFATVAVARGAGVGDSSISDIVWNTGCCSGLWSGEMSIATQCGRGAVACGVRKSSGSASCWWFPVFAKRAFHWFTTVRMPAWVGRRIV